MPSARLPVRPVQRCRTGRAAVIQTSAPAPGTRRRVLDTDTSAADRKTISNRNLHPPPFARPIPDSDSDLNFKSGSDSYSDSYSDPDTELDIGSDLNPGLDSDSELSIDSEAEEILEDIAQLEEEGPAKPRHEPQTIKLWKREGEIWAKFCQKIKVDPKDSLRKYKQGRFKAYLRWRKKHFRIKKQSSMEVYWKRLSQCYRDLTRHKMDGDVLDDVHNWIPNLELDKSKKEKHAMYVQDLYAILHALWVDDVKPLHGFIRVQISLLLLLSAATATRPGALVESASNKGSNKALCFKDIQLMAVRSIEDPKQSTIVVNVNLENIKNRGKDEPKKFTFRLEGLPAFCIVSHIIAMGFGLEAFKDNFTCIQDIFNLKIPAYRDMLLIKWKDEDMDLPFFSDVKKTEDGFRIVKGKAFPYAKYREIFVRMGLVAGFAVGLVLYQLRRASGRNLNSVLTPEERNQTMGHLGSTYEKYYTPTHIPHDFQSIYFGTPSADVLIASVARMGLSRDRRAPTDLNDDQLDEVRNDPELVTLREDREACKSELHARGFYPVSEGKGTDLHDRYESLKRKIGSTYQNLYRERLKKAIREFHDSADTVEIARQLSGKGPTEVLELPRVEYELRERANVSRMLFKPFKDEKARIKFINNLVLLCHRQETSRRSLAKRKERDFIIFKGEEAKIDGSLARKRTKGVSDSNNLGVSNAAFTRNGREVAPTTHRVSERLKQESAEPEADNVVLVRPPPLYPMILPHQVCLICIGDDELSYKERMKEWPRKDVLNKHIDTHFRWPKYQKEFECRHPECSTRLDGKTHFKRHGHDVHHVVH